MRIYCVSDLHLGYERTNYDAVSTFFEIVRKDADALILCGDIFDLWRYPVAKIEKATIPGFKECLEQLKELGRSLPITLIPGNHDYSLKKLWPEFEDEYRVRISDDFGHEGIFYTHGWQFDVFQRRYSWAYGWLVSQFPYLYQKYFKKPSRMGMGKNDTPSPEIDAIHIQAHKFAVKNKYKYIVMGHTHIPGINPSSPKWKYGRVVDCGDFVDSCSYVVITDGKPEVRYI